MEMAAAATKENHQHQQQQVEQQESRTLIPHYTKRRRTHQHNPSSIWLPHSHSRQSQHSLSFVCTCCSSSPCPLLNLLSPHIQKCHVKFCHQQHSTSTTSNNTSTSTQLQFLQKFCHGIVIVIAIAMVKCYQQAMST